MTQAEPFPATTRLAFQQFAAEVASHPACRHSLFAAMEEQAQRGALTPLQVDRFTRALMARIYRTMPNIAGLVQTALLNDNKEMAHTAMQNLEEEMGHGKTHQEMAQQAFNALRTAFSLPTLTLKQAHDDIPLPESYLQETVWISGYRDFPAIASWLQERASGGSGDNQKGMMADMFTLFEACRPRIGDASFRKDILPYFTAHNHVVEEAGHYRIAFDPSGIEFQHGQRAERDAMAEYAATPADKRPQVERTARAFLDAQSSLFDAIGQGIKPAAIQLRR